MNYINYNYYIIIINYNYKITTWFIDNMAKSTSINYKYLINYPTTANLIGFPALQPVMLELFLKSSLLEI